MEKDVLSSDLQQRNQQVSSLQDELSSVRKALNEEKALRAGESTQAGLTMAEITQQHDTEVRRLELQLVEKDAAILDAENKFKDSADLVQQLEAQQEAKDIAALELRRRLDAANEQCAAMQEQLGQLQQQVAQLQEASTGMSDSILENKAAWEKEKADYEQRLVELADREAQQQQQEQMQQVDELHTKLSQLEEREAAWGREKEEYERRLAEQLAENNEALEALRLQLGAEHAEALQQTSAEFTRALQAAQDACDDAGNTLKTEREIMKERMGEFLQAEAEPSEKENVYRMALEDVTEKAESAEETMGSIKEQYSAAAKDVASLQRQLAMSQEKIVELKKKVTEVEQRDFVDNSTGESGASPRLAFISAVWDLAKSVDKCRKMCQHLSLVRMKSIPEGIKVKLEPEVAELFALSKDTKEASRSLISRFLTDDEKLHLGIPLLLFDGGRDSAPVADWGRGGLERTSSLPSMEYSSDRRPGSAVQVDPQAKLLEMRRNVAQSVNAKRRASWTEGDPKPISGAE